MIKFENGKFADGTFHGIFDLEDFKDEHFNMNDTILMRDCWILYLPKGDYGARAFNAWEEDVCFIPSNDNIEDVDYELFWDSCRTFVFSDIHELHSFILDYKGEKHEDIVNIYDYIRECLEKEEVVSRYICTCGIIENSDEELFNELENIIIQKGVRPDNVFATLKMMLLNQYTIQFDEVVPKLISESQ